MKTREEIQQIAQKVIAEESRAISRLNEHIDEDFAQAVEVIFSCKGRVVVTGIGKSAIIAGKIVATFNSTGTPAIFMHAADAVHGDLGIIQHTDVVMCISNSGNTPEIKVLVPMLKSLGASLIGMVGNANSYLARQADYLVHASVEQEACPGNLAPTSSTTAQLVMGDAIAIALLECRGFSRNDFARYHPGGALGKQLYLKAEDLYLRNEKPRVDSSAGIQEVIIEISGKRLGATAVMEQDRLVGIITDGDLRRMLQNRSGFEQLTASDIMSKNPKTISKDTLAADALQIMRRNNITQLLVVDQEVYTGIVHLHDILNEGII